MTQPPYRGRFTVAYLFLGAALLGAGVGGWFAHAAESAPSCRPLPGAQDPMVTAISFIRNAVQRENPGAAYGLVTPTLRQGLSCARWAETTPVKPFADVDWQTASYKMTSGGTGQLVFKVTLAPKAHFLLELREQDGRWLVGFWDRL